MWAIACSVVPYGEASGIMWKATFLIAVWVTDIFSPTISWKPDFIN